MVHRNKTPPSSAIRFSTDGSDSSNTSAITAAFCSASTAIRTLDDNRKLVQGEVAVLFQSLKRMRSSIRLRFVVKHDHQRIFHTHLFLFATWWQVHSPFSLFGCTSRSMRVDEGPNPELEKCFWRDY